MMTMHDCDGTWWNDVSASKIINIPTLKTFLINLIFIDFDFNLWIDFKKFTQAHVWRFKVLIEKPDVGILFSLGNKFVL